MAYFECVYGGAIGGSIPLLVTCVSGLAGKTISCTNGVRRLTEKCPSSSPYEVTFNLPKYGTWIVSGELEGQIVTESILVEEPECDLDTLIDITVDFYSAASDTVSYTGVDRLTHSITTDVNGHASATIKINGYTGSAFTFTSGAVKDPTNQSVYYSKTITLQHNTTEVNVMPDHTLVWYGCYKKPIKGYAYKNSGAVSYAGAVAPTITKSTRSFTTKIPGGSNLRYGICAVDSAIDFSEYSSCKIFVASSTAHSDSSGFATSNTGVVTTTNPLASGFRWAGYVDITTTMNPEQTVTLTNTLLSIDLSNVSDTGYVLIDHHTCSYQCSNTISAIWLE